MKFIKVFLILILSAVILSGCDDNGHDVSLTDLKKWEKDIENVTHSVEQLVSSSTPDIKNTKEDQDLIGSETNNENYAYINNNKTELNTTDQKKIKEKGNHKFWVEYPDLDGQGRAGQVTALVTSDAVHSHSSKVIQRPSFAYGVHVAGEYEDGIYDPMKQTWKGEHSNNKILQLDSYRGYIYNKSHSLAWSLGGDMETHNLTLGTRAQNVGTNRDSKGGGMGYSETQIRNAIYDQPQTKVYYQITPVYKGKELIPRGSHVRAYSINDDGQTINLNVWVSNTQKGVNINYDNGTYTKN